MSKIEKFQEIASALLLPLLALIFLIECPWGKKVPLLSGQLAVLTTLSFVFVILEEKWRTKTIALLVLAACETALVIYSFTR